MINNIHYFRYTWLVKKSSLALFGGHPEFTRRVPVFNTIGVEEVREVIKVLESGVLSKYVGAPGYDFMGGPKVREMEEKFAEYFSVKHALAVNSWTSGLIAAVGAIGVEPGDEIIVSPWTMSASAMAILHWGAIPIFADINEEDFCLDPEDIKRKITAKTKAIMAIDIFGTSARIETYRKIADEHGLKLISDSAQAPGALHKNFYAGTLADIGGISLNYHKHIHSGEGGVIFTNDDHLARKMALIRNHAESVITVEESKSFTNMIGYNFRLGEIEAAIAIEQLEKLKDVVDLKEKLANQLTSNLYGLEGLRLPALSKNNSNVYYVYPLVIDTTKLGVSRSRIIEALNAENVPGLFEGYQNLHLLPIFQEKRAFGSSGWPWTSVRQVAYDYSKGNFPVAENLHSNSFLGLTITGLDFSSADIDQLSDCFKKVWNNLDALR